MVYNFHVHRIRENLLFSEQFINSLKYYKAVLCIHTFYYVFIIYYGFINPQPQNSWGNSKGKLNWPQNSAYIYDIPTVEGYI